MLGRVAAGRSERGRVCLRKTVQTPGAAAVWSGLPAARKEVQSKEGAEDAAAAGVGEESGGEGCTETACSVRPHSAARSAESRGCSVRTGALEQSGAAAQDSVHTRATAAYWRPRRRHLPTLGV